MSFDDDDLVSAGLRRFGRMTQKVAVLIRGGTDDGAAIDNGVLMR